MATNEATLLLKIKQTGLKSLNSIKKTLGSIKDIALKVGIAMAAVSTAVGKLALDSSKFDDVKKSFTNLAEAQGQDADKMLAKMRELSVGTISDMELMKKANNALLLGLPVDRFGDMLTIARSASKATGESMEFMLNSIVTGLGRGSKLMLDNLGIVFKLEDAYDDYAKTLGKASKDLTEAEKKQAFINKALATGIKNANAMGKQTISLSDRWEKLKAKSQNLLIVIGDRLQPMFSLMVDTLFDLTDAAGRFVKTEEFLSWSKLAAKLTNEFSGALQKSVIWMKQAASDWKRLFNLDFSGLFGEAREKEAQKTGDKLRAIEKKTQEQELKINKVFAEKKARLREGAAKSSSKKITKIVMDAKEDETAKILEEEKKRAERIAEIMSSTISGGMQSGASDIVSGFAEVMLPGFGKVAGQVFDLFSKDTDKFVEEINKILSTEFVENIITNIGELIRMSPQLGVDLIKGLGSGIMQGIRSLFTGVSKEFDSAMDKLDAEISKKEQELEKKRTQDRIGEIKGRLNEIEMEEQKRADKREQIADELAAAIEAKDKILTDRAIQRLKDKVSEEAAILEAASKKRIALENNLQNLLDKKAQQEKNKKLSAVDKEIRGEKELLERAQNESNATQEEIYDLQFELIKTTGEAERQEIENQIAAKQDVLAGQRETEKRLLDEHNTAKIVAEEKHGVKKQDTIDNQIAIAKMLLGFARTGELFAIDNHAKAKREHEATADKDELADANNQIILLKGKATELANFEIAETKRAGDEKVKLRKELGQIEIDEQTRINKELEDLEKKKADLVEGQTGKYSTGVAGITVEEQKLATEASGLKTKIKVQGDNVSINEATGKGTAFATGGIVKARQGGVPAIIGEAGRDEAVIPLDQGASMLGGTTVNITVNGGMLGDESSARELALAVDEQLLRLRQNNESLSFDNGIT